MSKHTGPRILVLDIETSPIISYTWGLFDQNVSLSQVKTDWNIIAFSAKWLGQKKIFYKDLRGQKDLTNDKELLKIVWKLMDESDIILTQNGKRFDVKKLNARFILNGMKPPSSFRQLDTLQISKKYFSFTSHKLEYMTDKLCTKYKKLTKRKYAGFDLWKECLSGNKDAWNEMQKYNTLDILSLEELYTKLQCWDNSLDFNAYSEDFSTKCNCGSMDFCKNGFFYSNNGKFQRYKCLECSSEVRSKVNLLSKEKRIALRR